MILDRICLIDKSFLKDKNNNDKNNVHYYYYYYYFCDFFLKRLVFFADGWLQRVHNLSSVTTVLVTSYIEVLQNVDLYLFNGGGVRSYYYYYYYYWYSAIGPVWAETELSQSTGMALVRCILGKFLGVACHCFPPCLIYMNTKYQS